MPFEIFLNSISLGLEINSVGYKGVPEVDDPSIDMDMENDCMLLTMTLRVSRIWKPEYIFKLIPVILNPTDTLSSQVRDIQENMDVIKEIAERRSTRNFLSVTSKTDECPSDHQVVWNGDNPSMSDSIFLSEDKKGIIVQKAGLYFLNTRFTSGYTTDSTELFLKLDDIIIAKCVLPAQCEEIPSTGNITKILPLQAGSTLSLSNESDTCLIEDPLCNEFTMYEL